MERVYLPRVPVELNCDGAAERKKLTFGITFDLL